jgi:hypothetical protein
MGDAIADRDLERSTQEQAVNRLPAGRKSRAPIVEMVTRSQLEAQRRFHSPKIGDVRALND